MANDVVKIRIPKEVTVYRLQIGASGTSGTVQENSLLGGVYIQKMEVSIKINKNVPFSAEKRDICL